MINKELLEKMYLVEHLTMAQIGERLGCTRQNVYHHLRRFKVDCTSAERFVVTCDVCGKDYSTTRGRYKSTVRHFCSKACYVKYLRNDEYRVWRQGQRIARNEMESFLGRSLKDGEVVHHIDGNNENNDIGNLKLFSSHGEHLAHHHELRRERHGK